MDHKDFAPTEVDDVLAGASLLGLGPKPYLVPGHRHRHFTLPSSDLLAATRIYHRRWTVLPSAVSDIQCGHLQPADLLTWVNTIFETSFKLTADVANCLLEFIDDGCDLGQVYGYLRPWMHRVWDENDFLSISAASVARKEKDYVMRNSAITGYRIINLRVPPRRVWDLFANRVVPYYVINKNVGRYWEPEDVPEESILPENLWAVSHSWVAPSERSYELTAINGKAWRVPLPRSVTLEDIRDELLILGAEYVFLDILCLRQREEANPQLETVRKREWRLDIPTIGYVYSRPRSPVIVYFNGLGLPFHDSPEARSSQYHWLNRVWTVQETPALVIIGGTGQAMTPFDAGDPHNWPRSLSPQLISILQERQIVDHDLQKTLRNVVTCSYANPVDQIAALGYITRCKSLPIYDADLDPEVAWEFLVECFPANFRLQLLFSSFPPSRFWRPTWKQILQAFGESPTVIGSLPGFWTFTSEEELEHIDAASPRLGYYDGQDANCHKAYVIEGCHIRVSMSFTSQNFEQSVAKCTVDVPLPRANGYKSMRVTEWNNSISYDREAEYILIGIKRGLYWIVAEGAGIRRIDGHRALEVSKVSAMTIPDTDVWRDDVPYLPESCRRRLVVYR